MRFSILALSLLLLFTAETHGSILPPYLPDVVDGLEARGLLKLAACEMAHRKNSTCTLAKAIKRRSG